MGPKMALDVTLRHVLDSRGEAHANAANVDGAVADSARADKLRAYPELASSRRCELVVVCIETGGRWSDEAFSFVWALAQAKARSVTPLLRRAAERSWARRCARVLSTACATAFATSLVAPAKQLGLGVCDGETPCLEAIFAGVSGEGGAGVGEGLVAAHTALCGGAGAPASCGLGVGACGGGSTSHGVGGVGACAAVAAHLPHRLRPV